MTTTVLVLRRNYGVPVSWWRRGIKLAIFAAVFAGCELVHAGESQSHVDAGVRIEALVARWDRPDSPGLTVAVLKGSEVVYEGAWGTASMELGVPLTPDSRLNAASVAKQVTAAAMLMLEEQGKLSLDDDIARYLPELPRYAAAITLRHLLSHTSGLRDVWTLADLAGWLPGDVRTQQQALRMLRRQRALNFPPGQAFGYSNSGYVLAAAVLERVTGESFAGWTRANLLLPAGMRSSRFLDDHLAIVAGYAPSYGWLGPDKGFVRDHLTSGAVGSGNLITTAGDLARWARYLLTVRLGARPLFAVLGESGVLHDGTETGYGFGVFVAGRDGQRRLYHGGNSAGYTAHLLVMPHARFAVAILANVNTVDASRLAEKITEIYLGDQPDFADSAQPERLGPAKADAYAGLYALGPERLLKVHALDGRLLFSLDGGAPRLMFPGGEHRFTTREPGLTLTFAPGPDHEMESVTLTVASRDFHGQRLLPPMLTDERLRVYLGSYYSAELETFYNIVASAQGLAVRRLRGSDFVLVPVDDDRFVELPSGGLTVRFDRNRFGKVRGFVLSTQRARGIVFRKP